MTDWHSIPRPPRLSGNDRVVPFLRWMAGHEEKRAATHRAKELRAIADWLAELQKWVNEQWAKERTEV